MHRRPLYASYHLVNAITLLATIAIFALFGPVLATPLATTTKTAAFNSQPTWSISVVVGTGSSGSDNGDLTNSTFNVPQDAVVDPTDSNKIYIADSNNYLVRLVTLDGAGGGVVTNFAGDPAHTNPPANDVLANESYLYPTSVALGTFSSYGSGLFISNVGGSSSNRLVFLKFSDNKTLTLVGGGGTSLGAWVGPMLGTSVFLGYAPGTVRVSPSGDVFLGITSSHVVLKMNSTGYVWRVAGLSGNNSDTGDGGLAVNASIKGPRCLCLDQAGTKLYITGATKLRVVDLTTGIIDTVPTVDFSGTAGCAVDSQGNIFVADRSGYRIKVIDGNTYAVTNLAGTGSYGGSGVAGPATSAQFPLLENIAFGGSDSALLVPQSDNYVRKVYVAQPPATSTTTTVNTDAVTTTKTRTVTGTISSLTAAVSTSTAGSTTSLSATRTSSPVTTAGPQTTLSTTSTHIGTSTRSGTSTRTKSSTTTRFKTQTKTAAYQKPKWYITSLAGISQWNGLVDGPISSARFNYLRDAQTDPSDPTKIYVPDYDNHVIRLITLNGTGNGGQVTTIAGNHSLSDSQFDPIVEDSLANNTYMQPTRIAVGNFSTYGRGLFIASSSSWASKNRLFFMKFSDNKIITVVGGGGTSLAVATFPVSSGQSLLIGVPSGLRLAPNGDIYLAFQSDGYVLKMNSTSGSLSITAGLGQTYAGDTGDGGLAVNASFDSPSKICLDPNGTKLYISSYFFRVVDLVTGIINSIPTVWFAYPGDCAVDSQGNIFLLEGPSQVDVVDGNTWELITVAGNGVGSDTGNGGPATSATFGSVEHISLLGDSALLLPDHDNNYIRKVYVRPVTTTTAPVTTSRTSSSLVISTTLAAAASTAILSSPTPQTTISTTVQQQQPPATSGGISTTSTKTNPVSSATPAPFDLPCYNGSPNGALCDPCNLKGLYLIRNISEAGQKLVNGSAAYAAFTQIVYGTVLGTPSSIPAITFGFDGNSCLIFNIQNASSLGLSPTKVFNQTSLNRNFSIPDVHCPSCLGLEGSVINGELRMVVNKTKIVAGYADATLQLAMGKHVACNSMRVELRQPQQDKFTIRFNCRSTWPKPFAVEPQWISWNTDDSTAIKLTVLAYGNNNLKATSVIAGGTPQPGSANNIGNNVPEVVLANTVPNLALYDLKGTTCVQSRLADGSCTSAYKYTSGKIYNDSSYTTWLALNIGGSGPAFFLQGFYFFAKGSEGNVSTYSYGFEADRGWDVTGRYYWTVTGVAAVPFVWKFDVSNYSLPNFLAVIGNGAKLSTNLALGKAVAASLNASLASIGQTQLSATYLKATADNLTSEYIFRLQGVPDSFPGGVVELIGGLNGNSRLWAVGLGSQNGTLSTVNQMLNVMGLSLSWKSMLAAPSTTVGSTAVLSFSFAPLNATAPDVWKWKTTLLTPFLQVQQGVTLQIVLRFPEDCLGDQICQVYNLLASNSTFGAVVQVLGNNSYVTKSAFPLSATLKPAWTLSAGAAFSASGGPQANSSSANVTGNLNIAVNGSTYQGTLTFDAVFQPASNITVDLRATLNGTWRNALGYNSINLQSALLGYTVNSSLPSDVSRTIVGGGFISYDSNYTSGDCYVSNSTGASALVCATWSTNEKNLLSKNTSLTFEKTLCLTDSTRRYSEIGTLSGCACRCCQIPAMKRTDQRRKCLGGTGIFYTDGAGTNSNEWFSINVADGNLGAIIDLFGGKNKATNWRLFWGSPISAPSVYSRASGPQAMQIATARGYNITVARAFKGTVKFLGTLASLAIEQRESGVGFDTELDLQSPLRIGVDVLVLQRSATLANLGPVFYLDASDQYSYHEEARSYTTAYVTMFGSYVVANATFDHVCFWCDQNFTMWSTMKTKWGSMPATIMLTITFPSTGNNWDASAASATVALADSKERTAVVNSLTSGVVAAMNNWFNDGDNAVQTAQKVVNKAKDAMDEAAKSLCAPNKCVYWTIDDVCSEWKYVKVCIQEKCDWGILDYSCQSQSVKDYYDCLATDFLDESGTHYHGVCEAQANYDLFSGVYNGAVSALSDVKDAWKFAFKIRDIYKKNPSGFLSVTDIQVNDIDVRKADSAQIKQGKFFGTIQYALLTPFNELYGNSYTTTVDLSNVASTMQTMFTQMVKGDLQLWYR